MYSSTWLSLLQRAASIILRWISHSKVIPLMMGKDSHARLAQEFQWNVRRLLSLLLGRLSGICYPVFLLNTAYVILNNTYVNLRSIGDVLCLGRHGSRFRAEGGTFVPSHS
jgi:hypothetical protein